MDFREYSYIVIVGPKGLSKEEVAFLSIQLSLGTRILIVDDDFPPSGQSLPQSLLHSSATIIRRRASTPLSILIYSIHLSLNDDYICTTEIKDINDQATQSYHHVILVAGFQPPSSAPCSSVCSLVTSLYKAETYIDNFLYNMTSLDGYGDTIEHVLVFTEISHKVLGALVSLLINYRRILLLHQSKDPGLYESWNNGIRLASGEFISNANPDDLRYTHHVSEGTGFLAEHPDIAVVASQLFSFTTYPQKGRVPQENTLFFNDGISRFSYKDMATHEPNSPSVLGFHNIPHCMPIWRKSLHNNYGYFDEDTFGFFADYAFWLKVLKNGEHGYKINKPLGYYYLNQDSYGRVDHQKRQYFRHILKETYADLFNYTACGSQADLQPSRPPRISVITVCRNAGKLIEPTIISILSQNYSDFEYIIIDGASTDDTPDIIARYGDNIDVFVSEPDTGIYDAMNKGVRNATGDYLIFMNAGDEFFDENAIANLAQGALETGADVVGGQTIILDSDLTFLLTHENFSNQLCIVRGMPFCHQALIYKKSLHSIHGLYSLNHKICSDYDFILKLYRNNHTFHEIAKFVSYFTRTGVSATQFENMAADQISIRRKYFPFVNEKHDKLFKTPYFCSIEELYQLYCTYRSRNRLFDDCLLHLISYQLYSNRFLASDRTFRFNDRKELLHILPPFAIVILNPLNTGNFKMDDWLDKPDVFGLCNPHFDQLGAYPSHYACLTDDSDAHNIAHVNTLVANHSRLGIRKFLMTKALIKALDAPVPAGLIDDVDQLKINYPTHFPGAIMSPEALVAAWARWLGYRDLILVGLDDVGFQKSANHSDREMTETTQSWNSLAKISSNNSVIINANPHSPINTFPKRPWETALAARSGIAMQLRDREYYDYLNGDCNMERPTSCSHYFKCVPNTWIRIARKHKSFLATITQPSIIQYPRIHLYFEISVPSRLDIYILGLYHTYKDNIHFIKKFRLYPDKVNRIYFNTPLYAQGSTSNIYINGGYADCNIQLHGFNIYADSEAVVGDCPVGSLPLHASRLHDSGDCLSALGLYQELFDTDTQKLYSDKALECARAMNFYGIDGKGLVSIAETRDKK